MSSESRKPMGLKKNYGSIPHLPGSRVGPAEHTINDGQARMVLEGSKEKGDVVWCQEKLDGSNVGVYRINNEIIPITRAGYVADTSPYEMHHRFYEWALNSRERFLAVLEEGERLCGEWLYQPHGTLYNLPHEPFVAFDVMKGNARLPYLEFFRRTSYSFVTPCTISGPISIEDAKNSFGVCGRHGAVDPIEGFVWRLERKREVAFLCKYVHHWKEDGKYLRNKWPREDE